MIFFTYEQLDNPYEFRNLIDCLDPSNDMHRIGISPVASTLVRKSRNAHDESAKYATQVHVLAAPPADKKYIFATGVGHAPQQWCGPDIEGNGADEKNPAMRNLFSFVKPDTLRDMQNGKAYFLIDQTHEGYQTPWLWDWFYNTCTEYNVPTQQIIYLTGNMEADAQYKEWASSKGLPADMLVIGWPHFENVIWEVASGYTEFGIQNPGKVVYRKLPDFEHHVAYKKIRTGDIKTFNILQKRTRSHRLWFYKYLFDADLIKNNIVSMNAFDASQTYMEGRVMQSDDYDRVSNGLPIHPEETPAGYDPEIFHSHDGWKFILALNDLTMMQSWCTVVSEASCSDWEGTCFLSEKTFKPVVCQHPFIIMGSKGSLKNLQKLGYKTFAPYIDESYDELDTWGRMEAITAEMKRIQQMPLHLKFEWLSNIEGILKYNFKHMENRSNSYVKTIFNLINNHTEK